MSRRERAPFSVAVLGGDLGRVLACGRVPIQDGPAGADIVIWTPERARTEPRAVGDVLHVLDLRDVRAEPGLAPVSRTSGLLLHASEAEAGAWSALAPDVPFAVVPHVAEAAAEPSDRFRALHILLGRTPSSAAVGVAERAAAWAAARRLPRGVADAEGVAGLAVLGRVGAAPKLKSGTVVLDLRAGADALGVPRPLGDAMARGAPVLRTGESVLPGLLVDPEAIEAELDAFAALADARRLELSGGSLTVARERFAAAPARDALLRALTHGLARARRRANAWRRPTVSRVAEHVLVVSDQALNLVDIRVHLPFDTLVRRGAIGGYSVLRHGEWAFSTRPVNPELRFDAVWVQRSADPSTQLLLEVLARPFVFDLDDNLLRSPAYREAFTAESIVVVRALLRRCAVLSCATTRLTGLLGEAVAEKAIVTANLPDGPPAAPAGEPSAVVWASSDAPALAGSRPEVERAVRDFCAAHGLPLLCIGAPPPAVLAESGLEVTHVPLLSYPAYLARLRGVSPGILVAPLETGADPATQDFVDGKSDVKVIEARRTGLVGVFSRAAPYLDSELAPDVLCDNTYEAWIDGLERARLLCLRRPEATGWPDARDPETLGPWPWAEAIGRARLDRPVSAREVRDAAAYVHGQAETLLTTPEQFDEEDYLHRHEDVRAAVASGVVASGYRHYVQSGFREGRAARRLLDPAAAWWSRLLATVSRVEAQAQARDAEIEGLRQRLALRRSLPARASAPGPAVAASGPAPDGFVTWHPEGVLERACPVCDAPGPHPLLLRAEGENLARCGKCGTCFYARQEPHAYEAEAMAPLLQQLYLEQNAGIHHQTRPLFAIDGGASVLDVGCGFGFSVDLAGSLLGWRAVGIDPSAAAGEGARLFGADIRQAYLTAETALGDPFGLVMASEVVEHVPEPAAFVALLRRFLRPGGALVLTTPDAAALRPELGTGQLIGILAVRVHLVLFTRESLALLLRRAGFRHVTVEAAGEGALVAYASDRPLRFAADADERHGAAYRTYLEALLERAEVGSALWNGAAGRLFALLAGAAPLAEVHALFGRIAASWRDRFGIDLARLRLPELLSERKLASTSAAILAVGQPLNLACVLLGRALLEARTPGRTAEAVLAWARPALLHAVQTRRVLQAENMIDLDLKATAWRARLLIADCLAELAPELEGEILRGLAEPSPGTLGDRLDPPPPALLRRIAPWFVACVAGDRFDDAHRVEPTLRDLDALCAALDDPGTRLRTLFALGVQRLLRGCEPAGALGAFERLETEARLLLPTHPALAREFIPTATEHVRLAAHRLVSKPA